MTSPTPTDLRSQLAELLRAALSAALPDYAPAAIEVERPRNAGHGDYASNVAMQAARQLRRSPRPLAEDIARALPASPLVEKVEVAGGGFVNFHLRPETRRAVVRQVLEAGAVYGHSDQGRGRRVQVEFVSANPTGPLHVGHGRGAAYGASVASLLEAAGYRITREYYVNDAGRQMDILALSTWLRYLELTGAHVPFPGNAYQGDYVREMARSIRSAHGDRYLRDPAMLTPGVPSAESDAEGHLDALIANARAALGADWRTIHDFALTEQLGDCRGDLAEFGVEFDCWFSEQSLHDSGMVQKALTLLEANGHLYEQDGARWFRASAFGDEKDRVVQRDNGQYTYFAADIAYHLNKYERGFERIVDVWGADHHGYVSRVKGGLQALGLDASRLEVALVQFAVLYRNGQKVSMSTRAGEFVTLRELRTEVGNDAARFFYVLRKSDQHLDFDLDLAKSQSQDNPVYYVQYAHARVCSVFEQWGGDPREIDGAGLEPLGTAHESALLNRLMDFPATVEAAARDLAPHMIAFYLRDLAGEFHSYYNATPFLVPEQPVRMARLALIAAVRQVIRNGLALLGVSAPEKM